jgi:hypothetical protein
VSRADLTASAIVADFTARAVPVSYNGTTLAAVFRFLQVDSEVLRTKDESARADQATLLLLKTDVAEPGYGDTAVIDSKTWRVMRRLKGGGAHTVKVLLERNRGRVA